MEKQEPRRKWVAREDKLVEIDLYRSRTNKILGATAILWLLQIAYDVIALVLS